VLDEWSVEVLALIVGLCGMGELDLTYDNSLGVFQKE
jgi:hypothetical protein